GTRARSWRTDRSATGVWGKLLEARARLTHQCRETTEPTLAVESRSDIPAFTAGTGPRCFTARADESLFPTVWPSIPSISQWKPKVVGPVPIRFSSGSLENPG